MNYAAKLCKIMHSFDWSQTDLARRAGVTKNKVGRWLHEGVVPYDEALLRISRATGLPVVYLLDDSLEEPPPPPLAPDEAYILRVVRALGIDADEAVRRLGVGPGNEKSGAATPVAERDRTALESPRGASGVQVDRKGPAAKPKGTPGRGR